MKTKEKLLKKPIMVLIIIALAALNVLTFATQIVNAEEEENINAKPIIEGTLEKYINYNISDNAETLVQYRIRTGINYQEDSDSFPITYNETVLYIGEIDGKYPYKVDVIMNSTEATNGNAKDNYSMEYNSNTGALTLKIYNLDEEGNFISSKIPSTEDRDDYTIICYYDTYTEEEPERNININIATVMDIASNEEIKIYGTGLLEKILTENVGDITSVAYDTEDIYNGYIKSNIINGTEYNTQYTENKSITISNKEVQQKIEITEENTFVRVNDEEITENLGNEGNLLYKSVKLEKQNIIDILGEEGYIEILDTDGNVLSTINQDTEFAEDGTFTITWEDGIENIVIKTSDILNEGILNLETTKEIKNTMQDIDNVSIKTTTNIAGIIEEEQEEEEETQIVENVTYTTTSENIIDIQDSETNVKFSLDTDELTNERQNEVTFDIQLNATSAQYNLFKDSQLKIELPSQVEKVILNNSSIVYGNGLELEEPYIETDADGNISIVANLVGEQTQYTEEDLELITNVKISATIILEKDIQNTSEEINFIYTNEYTLNGRTEENSIQKDIKIRSYNHTENATASSNTISTLAQQSTDGLNVEIIAKKGDVTLSDNDVIYEGEYIKYTATVTNVTDTSLDDVKIVASIPDGVTYGELEADYYTYNGEYTYNFDDSVTEKTLEIGTLESGETVEVYYEVQVDDLADGEEEKQITTNIKSYVGDEEATNWDLANVINPSSVTIFVDARQDNGENRWNYNVYLEGEEGKEVTIQIKLPEAFTPSHLVHDSLIQDTIPSDNITVSEDNIITTTLEITNDVEYVFEGTIDESKIDKNTDEVGTTLIAIASVSVDGNIYYANETRIFYEFANASIYMTSPTEGQEVEYEEEIEYNIVITNTGGSNYTDEDTKTVSVQLTDYLPEEVNPVSVTYENFEPIIESVTDNDNVTTQKVEYEKKEETEDISAISEDEDGNILPNVILTLAIPEGETVNITILATAGDVDQATKVENNVTIISENQSLDEDDSVVSTITLNKTSNTISHTILPYDNGLSGEDSDDSGNSDNTDDSDNSSSADGTYSISGVAWVDENEDGQRQLTEQLLSDITVMLLNTQNSNSIEAQTQTDSAGAYSFSGLESGQYIVIFKYNTDNYSLTEYRKNDVSDSVNSDVSEQEMTINGESLVVGATDILSLQSNMSNVDMGLIENKLYDLKLDKFISKVTVVTSSGTSTYEYENEQLVKVDIKAKEIEGAKVTVQYEIVVTNEGETSAYVNSVADYLPDGFVLADNSTQSWINQSDNTYINTNIRNQKIDAGESVTITLTATKTMSSSNTGTFVNSAEIQDATSTNGRDDTDSTPGNQVETEDDYSSAEIIISVGTGIGVYISISIILAVLITVGITVGVKKGKIKIRKIPKMSMFILAFIVLLFVETPISTSVGSITDYLPEKTNWDFDADTYYSGRRIIF